MAKFQIGEEVVVMASEGIPCQCNTQNSSAHPCRVRIAKIGRKHVHAFMTGDSKRPTVLATEFGRGRLTAVPIEEARSAYAANLRRYGKTPEAVALLVSAL